MSEPKRIQLPATFEELSTLRAGDQVVLSGTVYTMRDAGHVKTLAYLDEHGELPFGLVGQTLFYAGPSPAAAGRPLGSVGPTTASRMDFASPALYSAGITSSIGKGKRSDAVARACAQTGAVHFTAVGGVAALLATCVKSAETVAWPELGTEALKRLEIEDFPAFVAIDSLGNDVFSSVGKAADTPAPGSGEANGLDAAFSEPGASAARPDGSPALEDARKPMGRFITFEGGEGCGKSTQISLLAKRLEEMGVEVVVLREPGSTQVGEKIRDILLDPGNAGLDPSAELLLYEASRAQMVREAVLPALESGKTVLCDRFNDSTMAYQGYARGLGRQAVEAADRLAVGDLVPDRTIFLDRDTDSALEMARSMGDGADRIELEPSEFHEKVHAGFEAITADDPARVRRVEVADDAALTHEAVFREVADLFADAEGMGR